MTPFITVSIIFFVGEIMAAGIFWFIAKFVGKIKQDKISGRSIFKGVIERMFLFLMLVLELPQGLILFGALKIATRIKDEDKVSNDFFFIGNLVSIFIALGYNHLYRQGLIQSLLITWFSWLK